MSGDVVAAMAPISLGYHCETKYQICRAVHFREFPDSDDTAFRNRLFRWNTDLPPFSTGPFDWQVTPFPALLEYLRSDFRGVFELADLEIGSDGVVRHRRLATEHPHQFRGAGRLTHADLAAQYPAARETFDRRANRFRQWRQSAAPRLFVLNEQRPWADVVALIEALTADAVGRTELLLAEREGRTWQALAGFPIPVHLGALPAGSGKPADRAWEGDDEAWAAILQAFPLAAEPGAMVRWEPPQAPGGLRPAPPPGPDWKTVLCWEGAETVAAGLAFVGAGGWSASAAGARFTEPAEGDHLASPFFVCRPGAWVRVEAAWPTGARAQMCVQDQSCSQVAVVRSDDAVIPLPARSARFRLVFLPEGAGSVLPTRIEIALAG